jgi:hypothetical protein
MGFSSGPKEPSPKANDVVIHLRIGDYLESAYKPSIKDYFKRHPQFRPKPMSYFEEIASSEWYIENNKIFRIDNRGGSLKVSWPSAKKINPNIVIVAGGSHVDDRNYEMSKKYVKKVESVFNKYGHKTKVRLGCPPDDDFIFMCQSKIFYRSGGGFSNTICKIRERLKQ